MEILVKPNPISNIILLEESKIAYIPIPKAGCSSIKYAISEFKKMGIPKNRIHAELKMKKIEKKSDFEDYFIFSIVRNPIDRIYSAYKSKVTKNPLKESASLKNGVQKALVKYYGDAFFGGMSFDNYLQNIVEIEDSVADEHFRSQYFILYDRTGNPLCDYVGNLESIEKDIKYLNQNHNLPFNSIGHFGNKTKYVSEDLIKIHNNKDLKSTIYNRFKMDFDTFGYKTNYSCDIQ